MTGFVTRFGIDSTTLTLDDTTAVTVPNAELAKLAIRNLSRRTHWPVNAQFRLAHGALPGVRALLTDMERYCRNRADFAEMQPRLACRVVLADVSPDALLIAVSTYMSRAGCDQTSFERRRSDILCDLGDMITTHGLKLALPASSVRLDTP
jgi:small-conductance mechanosensitive channel